jgi:hypothetical protein
MKPQILTKPNWKHHGRLDPVQFNKKSRILVKETWTRQICSRTLLADKEKNIILILCKPHCRDWIKNKTKQNKTKKKQTKQSEKSRHKNTISTMIKMPMMANMHYLHNMCYLQSDIISPFSDNSAIAMLSLITFCSIQIYRKRSTFFQLLINKVCCTFKLTDIKQTCLK